MIPIAIIYIYLHNGYDLTHIFESHKVKPLRSGVFVCLVIDIAIIIL